jgi:hypothetical protein
LETVLGFTLGQLRAYSLAVVRAKKREHRDLLVLLRGSQYERRDFEKLIEALE